MWVPLVALAQVRILEEEFQPLPGTDALPTDLAPRVRFDEEAIRRGLPPPGGFGRADLRLLADPDGRPSRAGD